MGHVYSSFIYDPEITPDCRAQPTYDPLFGFPNGRKPREMIATKDEMDSVCLDKMQRDYCAHATIDLLACRNYKWPATWMCKHEMHNVHHCQFEDYKLRMKEFEREKRLNSRAIRIEKKKARLAMLEE